MFSFLKRYKIVIIFVLADLFSSGCCFTQDLSYHLLIQALKNIIRVLPVSRGMQIKCIFGYIYTLRVLKWAERLQAAEGGNLEVIRIASMLHDIGWEENVNHALISRKIAEEYLSFNQCFLSFIGIKCK